MWLGGAGRGGTGTVYSLQFNFLRPFGSKRLLASPSAYVEKNKLLWYYVLNKLLKFPTFYNNQELEN